MFKEIFYAYVVVTYVRHNTDTMALVFLEAIFIRREHSQIPIFKAQKMFKSQRVLMLFVRRFVNSKQNDENINIKRTYSICIGIGIPSICQFRF